MSTTARKLSSASWLDLYNCQSYHKIVLNSDIYRIVESNQLERFGKKGEISESQKGGMPLEGLIVDACDYQIGEWVGGCQTDASGFYSINTLLGSYILDVHDGTSYRPEYYNNAYDSDDATQVQVTQGETTSGIDFSLSRRVGSGPSLFLLLGE